MSNHAISYGAKDSHTLARFVLSISEELFKLGLVLSVIRVNGSVHIILPYS